MAKTIGILLTAAAVIAGFIFLVETSYEESTPGVSVVAANDARLPAGERLVLTHMLGLVIYEYHVTYDQEEGRVHFDCVTLFCSDLPQATLCGVGCQVDINVGWGDHFYIALRKDGTVSVKWPSGWTYRPA